MIRSLGRFAAPSLLVLGGIVVFAVVTARPREPVRGKITNSIGMRLTLIPAGEFLMGSPDDD